VDLPDFKGRTRILGVHSRGKPLEPDVDLEPISRRTPGFSGAQLENLMNEAAISAARAGKSTIGWEEIDRAVDRVMVGLEKKGGNPQLKQKELVAYHEAGHAIVGALVPDYDQVQKDLDHSPLERCWWFDVFRPSGISLGVWYVQQAVLGISACGCVGRPCG
jgi:cell division protease FtsH